MKKTIFFILCFLSSISVQHISGMHPEHVVLLWELKQAQQGPELVRIAQSANPSARNKALVSSSQENNATITRALLAAGADPNYIDEKSNATPLSNACTGLYGNDGACISLLLDAKADINLHLLFPQVKPALRTAIICKNFAALPLLIADGADTSNALEWAQESYRKDCKRSDECPNYLSYAKAADRVVAFFKKFGCSEAPAAAQAGPADKREENKENEQEEDAPVQHQQIAREHGNHNHRVYALGAQSLEDGMCDDPGEA